MERLGAAGSPERWAGAAQAAAPPAKPRNWLLAVAAVAGALAVFTLTAFCQESIKAGTPPPAPRQPAPGEVRTNPADGQPYVWIPAGTFQMGCSPGDDECGEDEDPRHAVTLSRGFWMGRTEVTVGAFSRSGRAMPPAPSFEQDENHPVVNVTWDEATSYCQWAGGRLPTEAEWEYAARAGTTGPRYGELDGIAWYSANSGGRTHPVAQKRANAFGLYDMLGNVWEWVADRYSKHYYDESDSRDPRGPSGGDSRLLRGGCWILSAWYARASFRLDYLPHVRLRTYGFRCVREAISP